MSELTEYKESLRLFKDKVNPLHKETSIPHAHKIRYHLVEKLVTLNAAYQDSEIANLIDEIKAIKNPLPKPTAINMRHPAQAKIKKILAHGHSTYQTYYSEMMMGFEDILKKYHSFHTKGTTFSSFIKRIGKNYSYNGNYEFLRKDYGASAYADCFQTFIELIDQIALIDTSGVLIEKLLKSLQDRGCSEFDVSDFLDDVFEMFVHIQKNYYYNVKKRDKNALNILSEYYKPETAELKDYYQYVMYNVGDPCAAPIIPEHNKENNFLEKFQYDINQLAKENKNEEENFQGQLKVLKKKIHHFAQSLGMPARIKKTPAEENIDEASRVESTPSPIQEDSSTSSYIDESSNDSKTEMQKKENSKKENQKREEYEKYYYLEKNADNYTYFINADKQEKRHLQIRNKKIARKAAFLTSMAEGMIGGNSIIVAYLFFPPIAVFLIAALMGWFINNLLYRNDNQDVLDAFTLKKKIKNDQGQLISERLIFLDEHNKPLSKGKKIGLCSVFALTLCTGIVYGALSFMNSQSVFIKIFVGMSHLLTGFFASHMPMVLTILGSLGAACPAAAMFIGMTCLLFKVIADFVRNNRYQKICNYLHEHFKAPWQAMGTWKCDWKKRITHLGKCIFHTSILALTIAATIGFTVASMGVFYQQTLNFLSYASKPTQIISAIFTFINAITTLPFQVEGANKILQPICKRHTFSGLTKIKFERIPLSHVQKQVSRARKIAYAAVGLTAAGNGLCIGYLDKISNGSTLQPLKMGALAKKTSSSLLEYSTFASSTICTALPNCNAGFGVFKQKEPRMNIKGDQQEETASRKKSLSL